MVFQTSIIKRALNTHINDNHTDDDNDKWQLKSALER